MREEVVPLVMGFWPPASLSRWIPWWAVCICFVLFYLGLVPSNDVMFNIKQNRKRHPKKLTLEHKRKHPSRESLINRLLQITCRNKSRRQRVEIGQSIWERDESHHETVIAGMLHNIKFRFDNKNFFPMILWTTRLTYSCSEICNV